jgi:hypothetical protein
VNDYWTWLGHSIFIGAAPLVGLLVGLMIVLVLDAQQPSK